MKCNITYHYHECLQNFGGTTLLDFFILYDKTDCKINIIVKILLLATLYGKTAQMHIFWNKTFFTKSNFKVYWFNFSITKEQKHNNKIQTKQLMKTYELIIIFTKNVTPHFFKWHFSCGIIFTTLNSGICSI